jgi:uncharacterized protein YbjT (DUF2867 family)
MIAICGATGLTGSEVVRALLLRGEHVRVVVRDPGKAHRLFGDAVEVVTCDYADPHGMRAALDGASALFLSGGDDRRRVAFECGAIDAAAALGVRRVVKLSSIVAEPGSPVAYWDWHGRIEEHLWRSGVPSVVLRTSFFMSNLLASAGQVAAFGRLLAPAADARIAMIDPRDVGAAAAEVLMGAGEAGSIAVLTGPRAVSYDDVAHALTAATGHVVTYVHVRDDAAFDGLVGAGVPPFAAEQLVAIFGQLRTGIAGQITNTVQALTGRPPRDLAAFLQRNADSFLPGSSRMAG